MEWTIDKSIAYEGLDGKREDVAYGTGEQMKEFFQDDFGVSEDNHIYNQSWLYNQNFSKENTLVNGVREAESLTIFVHGTNSSPADADQNFIKALDETYNEEVVQFEWSGENNKAARTEVAQELLKFVENYEFKDGEKFNLIGHSHGGNVEKEFTQFYKGDKRIDEFITLEILIVMTMFLIEKIYPQ